MIREQIANVIQKQIRKQRIYVYAGAKKKKNLLLGVKGEAPDRLRLVQSNFWKEDTIEIPYNAVFDRAKELGIPFYGEVKEKYIKLAGKAIAGAYKEVLEQYVLDEDMNPCQANKLMQTLSADMFRDMVNQYVVKRVKAELTNEKTFWEDDCIGSEDFSFVSNSEDKDIPADEFTADDDEGREKVKRSFQIYTDVYERLQQFQDKYDQYTKTAVLNKLLDEALSKYDA